MDYKEIPVVILCGGHGTRMKEETEFRPKPLVDVGGIPMILHIMNIYYHYGFKEFIFPLGYKGEMIKDYFLNYKDRGDLNLKINRDSDNWVTHLSVGSINEFDITFINTGLETQTGSRLKVVEKHLKGWNKLDTFMLTYGDGVADIDINKLVDFHFSHKKIATVTGIREPDRFGDIISKDGLVVEYNEKAKPKSRLVNGGFYVLNTKFLDYIDDTLDCKLEYLPLQRATEEGQLMTYIHEGKWACADMVREVDHLNELCNKGEAFWIK